MSELVPPASLQVNVEDMSEEGREASGQGGVPMCGGGEEEGAQEVKFAMLMREGVEGVEGARQANVVETGEDRVEGALPESQ